MLLMEEEILMVDENKTEIQSGSDAQQVDKEQTSAAQTETEQEQATFSMQGVSGKVITGTVKVKKVKKADKKPAAETPAETEEKTEPAAPSEAAQTTEPASQKVGTEAPRPRKISSGAKATVEAPAEPTEAPVETPAAEPEVAEGAPRKVTKEAPAAETTPAEPVEPEPEAEAPQKKVKPEPPRPRKIGTMADLEPKPVKPEKSAPKVEKPEPAKAEPAAKAEPKAEPPKPAEVAEKKAPAGPRKIASGGDIPQPRKLASGDKPAGPRKISSAAADDSLAATARAFATRKTEKENARTQPPGERTRYTGGRGRGPQGGGFSGGPGRPPFGSGGFDKDKDEDDQKFRSGPRKPRAKKDPAPDPFMTRGLATKNKFTQNKDNKSTRSRDFAVGNDKSRRSKDFFDAGEQRYGRGKRKSSQKDKDQRKEQTTVTHVSIPAILTVKEFAEAISRTSADVIMHLMKNGIMATMNQELDYETAAIIAEEFGVTTELLKEVELAELLFDDSEDEEENLQPRPPVVVVMGHVDHGKTTLLDSIRSSAVASGEAGGITQRIGAYMTELNGRKITFLDTPGHEAFTTMRARGAQATDIAILVVAADDGVMPQTVEAINHAKAAGTEIIVAINKMDKPGANPDKVKQELSNYELIPEEWGGSTVMVPLSAKTGEGMNELLEMVLLTADVLELKADPNRQAKGIIIEAQLDKNRGTVATLLVQRGTLRQGDTIVANTVVGNIRAMRDANGIQNQPAGPSVPVEVIGLPEVPEAGSLFYVVEDERVARQFAEQRRVEERQAGFRSGPAVTLDNLFTQIEEGKLIDFNIVVKADVVGSVEAMRQSLERLSNDEVRVNIIHGAAGAINESDLRLAEASGALVIGFNVRPNNTVTELARELDVEIKNYDVIYQAIEEIEAAMKGMLAPEYREVVLGHVEIRETYKVSNVGTIGGGYVTDGKIVRNSDIRLLRDSVVIYTGKLGSLRRFKDDVREVAAGYECGVSIDNYNDIKVGDVIEAFATEEIERD